MRDEKEMPGSRGTISWRRKAASCALCLTLSLALGLLALALSCPGRAMEGAAAVVKNFWNEPGAAGRAAGLGRTLAGTAPLAMCALGAVFALKAGMVNLGAAGQYAAGAGASLYCALVLKMPWWVCVLAAAACGAALGALPGLLKGWGNVNEILSGLLLNRISLYAVHGLLAQAADPAGGGTRSVGRGNPSALIPSLGLEELFGNEKTVTAAIPLALGLALLAWGILGRTRLGLEVKAAGLNRRTALYRGARDRGMLLLAGAIAGGLSGLGASMMYLSDGARWDLAASALPAMGCDGVAAALLGGMNPMGALLVSFLLRHLSDGSARLEGMGISPGPAGLVSAFAVYLSGFMLFFRERRGFRPASKRGDEQKGENGG